MFIYFLFSQIGADMVLVANGGLGSAFDELELNRILCQHYNVRIAGGTYRFVVFPVLASNVKLWTNS
jgi:hypothetical protein